MGASESTARTNVTNNQEEEERHHESSGVSMEDAAKAVVAIASVGAAALQISRMLSNNTESQEKENPHMTMSTRTESGYGLVPYPTPRALSSPRPYKMNTDGSCRPNQGRSGYVRIAPDDPVMKGPSGFGGILRDDRGKWVRGFLGFIETSDCLTTEIHGIYNGLLLLDKLGCEGSILESDSEAATKWITEDSYRLRSKVIRDCWDIIMKCRRLVCKNTITISCCSRDANKCADKLANMAIEKRAPYVEIIDVPNEIKHIIDRESSMMC